MRLMTMLLCLLFLFVSDWVMAATDKNSSVAYMVDVRSTRQISATGLTSSDTVYDESKCIGGMLTFYDACRTTKGKTVDFGLLYRISIRNKGATTIDASLLVFSAPFTSPGDNVAWAMDEGRFRETYLGRVDFPQTAQVEGGGDTYAEVVAENLTYFCAEDRNVYGQLVKNLVGPVSIGGDTRSASADTTVGMCLHLLEPK